MPYDPMVAIEAELQSERASALGEAGRKLEKMVAALSDSEDSIDDLAEAAWFYMIVREAVGMFDHAQAFEFYGVPRHVLARVGVMKKKATS